MRPGAEIRPPGIYAAMADPEVGPLSVADVRAAGFIGIAQRGPLDVPTRVTSVEEFDEIYGYTGESYLSDSVESFFRNGGHSCYVVRVAHAARGDVKATADHASSAEFIAVDEFKKPTLRVRANSEGAWGNNISVAFEHSQGADCLLTLDLELGSGEAQVNSSRGFQVGQLAKISDRENHDFVVLTKVSPRSLEWSSATPVNRKYRAASPTRIEVVEFELHVSLRERKEVFKHLQLSEGSRRYAPRVIAAESRLVALDDLGSKSPPPNNLPATSPSVKLTGGRDGTELITPEDFVGHDNGPADRCGLMALVEIEDVAQLVCPDAMLFIDRKPGPEGEMKARRVQDAMVDLCENLKDRFAILDCPQTIDVEAVRRWRQRTDSSYAAYYWPWLGMVNRHGMRRLPPSAIMAGIYARTDTDVGVHQAPANVDVRGALDLSVQVTEDDLGRLNGEGINVIRVLRGIRPWGARTASSDPDWRFINVRRLFIMLRNSLEVGMRWVPFEGNNHKTWELLSEMVKTFLAGLHEQGMFVGGKPEDAFFVRCDSETNPPDAVDSGILTCEIGVAPVIPAEFIMIQVVEKVGEPS